MKGIAGGLHNRLAFRYSIRGDLRFISHQDTLRLFRRAFARADLPLRHSEGFNPHPRLSIVLPRPVGVASDDEMLVVAFRDEQDSQAASSRLAETVPDGLHIESVGGIHTGERMRVTWVEYDIAVSGERRERIAPQVDVFLNSERFEITRTSKKGGLKVLDLRGFIVEAVWQEQSDGNWSLRWRQEVSIDGTARIAEVLEAFGFSSRDDLHRVTRRTANYHT